MQHKQKRYIKAWCKTLQSFIHYICYFIRPVGLFSMLFHIEIIVLPYQITMGCFRRLAVSNCNFTDLIFPSYTSPVLIFSRADPPTHLQCFLATIATLTINKSINNGPPCCIQHVIQHPASHSYGLFFSSLGRLSLLSSCGLNYTTKTDTEGG